MRKVIKHYNGEEITEEVIQEIHLIAMKRYDEGMYTLLHEGVDTLLEMCYWHDTEPEEENIILAQDWFIIYAIRKEEIEILEWVAISNVENKLTQTIEMFNTFKNILLINEQARIIAYMKHLTSYPFYQKFLTSGYFQEFYDHPQLEQIPSRETEKIARTIDDRYSSLSEYLKSSSTEFSYLEPSIYHNVSFKLTDKFIKRYKK